MIVEFTLDSKSIGEAIDKIRKYRKEFEKKCEQVVSELAELGYQTAYEIFRSTFSMATRSAACGLSRFPGRTTSSL